MKIPVCVINLPEDEKTFIDIKSTFSGLDFLEPVRIEGVRATSFPKLACNYLTGNSYSHLYRGTLGVFFSHIKCWEFVSEGSAEYGLIIEDDVTLKNLKILEDFVFPPDIDLVFCNDRTAYLSEFSLSNHQTSSFNLLAIEPVLKFVAQHKRAIGGDGYLISKAGASKLLNFVAKDGLFSHVDLRIFAYCLNLESVDDFICDDASRNVVALRKTYHQSKLVGRVLVPSLSYHTDQKPSRRAFEDRRKQGEIEKPSEV
jgi:GR25 family glycosyltransferase involved in LPS biosynthesis